MHVSMPHPRLLMLIFFDLWTSRPILESRHLFLLFCVDPQAFEGNRCLLETRIQMEKIWNVITSSLNLLN